MSKNSRIVLIGGPTASGKSAYALRIAQEKNGSIINADAMQIYAGLPLLTAQPDAEAQAKIPHLLYETTDPSEASSAGRWLVQAKEAINQTWAAGKTPILVGGTGLYFKALIDGLSNIPSIPDDVRADVAKLYVDCGEEEFRARLAKLDPESALRLAPNDRQRLIRAYEVVAHTGKKLSDWHEAEKKKTDVAAEAYSPEYHLLSPPREELYAACDKRFLFMIEHGALDEVRKLMERNLSPALPSMKILGVRELAAHLREETSLDDAIAKAQQLTRNYAKRQMTWFRNQWAEKPVLGKETFN